MAGNQNSGGYRPSAPQNNPANVSATGGNGQMAKPTQSAKYIPGQPWGQGQSTMDQQQAAPMAGTPTPEPLTPSLPPVTPIGAPTEHPDEPITHGVDVGPGAGSDIINTPAMATPTPENSIQMVQALYMQDPSNQDLRYMLENLSKQGRL
jgi:hypothetical protein